MKRTLPVIGQKLIYQGRVVRLEELQLRAPDGKPIKRELIRHYGSAVIVPMLDKNHFVLVYQYRVACHGYMLEFPAGTKERNESPLACAKREIVEEINYKAGKWTKLGKFYPAPGVSTELMHMYLATDLAPKIGKMDDDEWLETRVVSRKELRQQIDRGQIVDAKTVIGFFLLLEYEKTHGPR